MLSRTLILATVMLWIGPLATERALAQENLEAGKSPSQIFAGTCAACHKSPRGLLKTVPPGSLAGFLRQHYTTSPNMANVLSAYLVSNGANDPKAAAASPKEAKGAKEGAKEGARESPREARQEPRPVEQLDRFGRRQHPMTIPQEAAAPPADKPQANAPPQPPPQAASKWSGKQKLSKRGKPSEELPKEEPAAATEPSANNDTPKGEPSKPEVRAPAADTAPQSAKMEPAKETPGDTPKDTSRDTPSDTLMTRPDPIPPVTPSAPSAAPAAATPAPTTSPDAAPPAVSAAAAPGSGNSEPMPVMSLPPSQPGVTASAPPQPPVVPAGPPVPPISQ